MLKEPETLHKLEKNQRIQKNMKKSKKKKKSLYTTYFFMYNSFSYSEKAFMGNKSSS